MLFRSERKTTDYLGMPDADHPPNTLDDVKSFSSEMNASYIIQTYNGETSFYLLATDVHTNNYTFFRLEMKPKKEGAYLYQTPDLQKLGGSKKEVSQEHFYSEIRKMYGTSSLDDMLSWPTYPEIPEKGADPTIIPAHIKDKGMQEVIDYVIQNNIPPEKIEDPNIQNRLSMLFDPNP